MLESLTNTINGTSLNTSFTYDIKGNINTITEGTVQKVEYFYDNLNQLKRENNVYINKTIVYSYDIGGNITSRTEYTYTTQANTTGYSYDSDGNLLTTTLPNGSVFTNSSSTGRLSTEQYPNSLINTTNYTATDLSGLIPQVLTYQYTDSSNPNRLTKYSNNDITYDSNGNTQTFNGWTYSWQNVNQLSGMTSTGNTISYQYNSDNIRTSKIVNGTTTNYNLDDNNNITSETNGTDTFSFFYNSNGSLVYFTLNGTAYNYEKNLHGDIIGIVDSTGNEVVTYTYDSWGKLINIGGSLAGTVGVKNSMRYR